MPIMFVAVEPIDGLPSRSPFGAGLGIESVKAIIRIDNRVSGGCLVKSDLLCDNYTSCIEGDVLDASKKYKFINCARSGSRSSSDGHNTSVYCVAKVVKIKGSRDDYLVPIGTAFSISGIYAVTAYHNCYEGNGIAIPIALVKTLNNQDDKSQNQVIYMAYEAGNNPEDWAVLRRLSGTFETFVKVCPRSELPIKGAHITVNDHPSAIINTMPTSTSSVFLASTHISRVSHYGYRIHEERLKKRPKLSINNSKLPRRRLKSNSILDVVFHKGKITGSCGAPYFSNFGKVFAFHVSSAEDENSSTATSLVSGDKLTYSNGHILCRLPEFIIWHQQHFPDEMI